MATVNGVNVQAHRPPPTYNQVTTIPTNPLVPELAYNNFFNEVRGREQGNYNVGGSLLRLKEALISMAMFGPGNVNVSPNEQLNRTFLEFGVILQKLLPPEIGFRKIAVHLPDVVVETSSGTFVLDAASGGLMSIIEIAWQVFLFSRFHEQFTVLIDEPENHLHPSMQRQVLGALVSAFPDVQFIVATHSPFIISSVEDSHVYVLQSHENRTSKGGIIRSERLNLDEKAGTANDVLRDVLGVSITLPIWAASSLENIAKNFTFDDLTRDRLDELRTKLAEAGLSELYPETLAKISEQ